MIDKQNNVPVAIVTGGSRGIGQAIVERLARSTVKIYFTYCNHEDEARNIEEQLNGSGSTVIAKKVDVSALNECEQFIDDIISENDQVDMLVNNAGITADGLLALMTEEAWSGVLNVSLNGLFGMSRQIARQMMRQRSGRIVNISSVSGLIGVPGQVNYCTVKAGVIGFTRALAKELAASGVRVNAVAPGYIETDMLKKLGKRKLEQALASVPAKRFGHADEVAQLVGYLLTDAPDYLTGQVIAIDGGLT